MFELNLIFYKNDLNYLVVLKKIYIFERYKGNYDKPSK
jgi:hypothetical protein